VCNAEGVKLLEAEHESAPAAAPESPAPGSPQPQELPEGTTACRSCGAPMEPGQDWCLNCGTAAKGTLGQQPGWRAARTIIALTALLVLGAAAASYAALTDDGAKPPASSAPVAQAPAAATPPAATPPAATTPTTPKATKLPKVTPPKTTSTPAPAASSPAPATPAPASSGVASTGSSSAGTSTGSASSGSSSSTSTSSSEGEGSGTSSTTTSTAASPVVLASGAASVYDPYHRVAAAGTAQKAIDGNPSTSWFVTPTAKPGAGPDVGLLVDLGAKRNLRGVHLKTTTPGFRVELYATDVATAPPDILDARWSHLRNRGDVGTDEAIANPDDPTTKYRKVLLWFTKPPAKGTTIRVNDLEVLS